MRPWQRASRVTIPAPAPVLTFSLSITECCTKLRDDVVDALPVANDLLHFVWTSGMGNRCLVFCAGSAIHVSPQSNFVSARNIAPVNIAARPAINASSQSVFAGGEISSSICVGTSSTRMSSTGPGKYANRSPTVCMAAFHLTVHIFTESARISEPQINGHALFNVRSAETPCSVGNNSEKIYAYLATRLASAIKRSSSCTSHTFALPPPVSRMLSSAARMLAHALLSTSGGAFA